MANALKRINQRVKALQKRHPKTKRTTLQKQAGREWRAGKLKGVTHRRKPVAHKPRKKRISRRRAHKPKLVTKTRVVYRVFRPKRKKGSNRSRVVVHRNKSVTGTRRRRVGKKDSMFPVIALGVIGIGAYLLLHHPSPTPQLIQTGNPVRDNSAANILAWATAGGIAISAIAKLIEAINSAPDDQVEAVSVGITNGQPPPDSWLI